MFFELIVKIFFRLLLKESLKEEFKDVYVTSESLIIPALLSSTKRKGDSGGGTTSSNFSTHFFSNVAIGYDILLHIFQYLKVQVCMRFTNY